jgi:hypothetical protein
VYLGNLANFHQFLSFQWSFRSKDHWKLTSENFLRAVFVSCPSEPSMHTHTHTHSHTQIHSLSLTHTHSHTHVCTYMCIYTYILHTYLHIPSACPVHASPPASTAHFTEAVPDAQHRRTPSKLHICIDPERCPVRIRSLCNRVIAFTAPWPRCKILCGVCVHVCIYSRWRRLSRLIK